MHGAGRVYLFLETLKNASAGKIDPNSIHVFFISLKTNFIKT